VLIRRNQRTLETLEEKYLTRSSAALADRIAAYYGSATVQLKDAANAIRLARELTGKDPFTSAEGPAILGSLLQGESRLVALRGLNPEGLGSFIGPEIRSPEVEYEFRKGFASARDGHSYEGKPFGTTEVGPVAVLAMPVDGEEGERLGVVEALVSWNEVSRQFREQAQQEVSVVLVDRSGRPFFPLASRRGEAAYPSSLVEDFKRFPARVTRSEKTARGHVLASIAPVGRPDWAVLLERDRDLAFASVDEMIRDTLLWSAAALAGALLLALFFARRLSRPISRLAESTRAISQGEYGATVRVGGTAEIADLSESFNRMSGSIRDAFDKVRKAAEENHELFMSSIRALAAAIDAKDPYTAGHSERVSRYASSIAREMHLPEEDISRVRLAALLHDVGKIGVDDRIIRKPTALTEEEFEIMKCHPVKGAAIMGAIPQLADVIPGMKYHHEKWEGGGYPEGIRGEQIPMQARIVSVADCFDAMTTSRPYQRAMEIPYVVRRIQELAPSRYDPVVVDAFVRAYHKGELVALPKESVAPILQAEAV
jgi:putative nucleotidyltransferase with HDIG domain